MAWSINYWGFKVNNPILYQIGKPGTLGNSGNTGAANAGLKPPIDMNGLHHLVKGTDVSANKNGMYLFRLKNWHVDDSFYNDLNASGQQLLGGLGKDGSSNQQQN